MGEILPTGEVQGYSSICRHCKKEIKVNIQGDTIDNHTCQLTVTKAKELGYEFYGFSDEGWQAMNDINDFRPDEATGKECLFNIEPKPPFTTTAERVKEILSENLSSEWDTESRDDTGEMEDFLNEIPLENFNAIAAILNEAMANKHAYSLTDIKLIPNN